ncbi:WSCD family member AAEL009094-like [Phlebotomus papatasi]|uniref:WSCD family member AAEL009094-like n=1 Tax=Phlebotomus papatasi TaxID=29031 RepID=UPI002483B21B|nr:WSCD family member AAEL009094-like [Phlebotomus papatasi]
MLLSQFVAENDRDIGNEERSIWCQKLKFLPSDKMTKPVALASFPGSGNTWLRYLLQQATGILTGSVYLDYDLISSSFPGEGINNSSVLVVKTHEWDPNEWINFRKAILLVREPYKAILAEFNRQHGGHIGEAEGILQEEKKFF